MRKQMYKSYKYTKQTRDIFFKNIMGLLSYEKWLNRFNTQNGDLEIQSLNSEWWFGNSKCNLGVLHTGYLVIHKVYSIDCPVRYYGENFLSPL